MTIQTTKRDSLRRRVRAAWNLLRGRPTAYRVSVSAVHGQKAYIAECVIMGTLKLVDITYSADIGPGAPKETPTEAPTQGPYASTDTVPNKIRRSTFFGTGGVSGIER